jgi:outer membrane lipoprotein-sorting protein
MRGMNRRQFLALPLLAAPLLAAAPARPALSAADQQAVARVAAYLDAIHTLKTRFLQVSANGSTANGTAWLQRPGEMRFQYDPPSPLLLQAGRGWLIYVDKSLPQTSAFQLSDTPLGILLAPRITLTGDVTVTRVAQQTGEIDVTLVRTDSPNQGSLTLIFSTDPLTLREWSLMDQQGNETRVSLFNVELGGTFDPQLFAFQDPRLQKSLNAPSP